MHIGSQQRSSLAVEAKESISDQISAAATDGDLTSLFKLLATAKDEEIRAGLKDFVESEGPFEGKVLIPIDPLNIPFTTIIFNVLKRRLHWEENDPRN